MEGVPYRHIWAGDTRRCVTDCLRLSVRKTVAHEVATIRRTTASAELTNCTRFKIAELQQPIRGEEKNCAFQRVYIMLDAHLKGMHSQLQSRPEK